MIRILLLFTVLCMAFDETHSNVLADQYLDIVLQEPLQQEIKARHLDPASLPDFQIPFKTDLGLIPISGKADFKNGVLHGLSRVERLLECEGPSFTLEIVTMECGLNFTGMDVVYDVHASVRQLPSVPFQVTAYVNESQIRSGITGSPSGLDGQLKLFEITKLGDINVRPSNLGLLKFVYNAVEEKFRERVRKELTVIILNQFRDAFQKAITQIRLPDLVQFPN